MLVELRLFKCQIFVDGEIEVSSTDESGFHMWRK
jgi:hypothetical protein